MKLLSYQYNDSINVGILTPNGVISIESLRKYTDKELNGSLETLIEEKQFPIINKFLRRMNLPLVNLII